MMDCETLSRYLDLYLDGELAAEDRAEVEAHLKVCDGCKHLALAEIRLRTHVRQAMQSARAPSSLRALVQQRIREQSGQGWRVMSTVAVVIVVVLVGVVGYSLLGMGSGDPLEEVLEVHRATTDSEIYGDGAQVVAFLRSHAPFPFRLPLQEGDGVRLVGAKVTRVGETPAVLFMYDFAGKRITIAQYPAVEGEIGFRLHKKGVYTVATYGENGLVHTLVSDLSDREVKRFLPAVFPLP